MSDIQPLSWPEGCPSGGPVRRLACRRAADSSALGARRRTPTTTWRLRPVAFSARVEATHRTRSWRLTEWLSMTRADGRISRPTRSQ
jgi:hypothetical protein